MHGLQIGTRENTGSNKECVWTNDDSLVGLLYFKSVVVHGAGRFFNAALDPNMGEMRKRITLLCKHPSRFTFKCYRGDSCV